MMKLPTVLFALGVVTATAPGANWKGPIKKFRLVVDKSDPAYPLSFCMDGVRKISPTQFEVTKTNFEPETDLKILLVRWFNTP